MIKAISIMPSVTMKSHWQAINLKLFGEEHPDVAMGYNNLGFAWLYKGDFNKALNYYEKSYDIIRKTYGAEHHYAKNLEEMIARIKNEMSNNTNLSPCR